MHFKGHIITKELPTKEKLEEILKKYYYENETEEDFKWDWYSIGGRFGGSIKINFDPNENEDDHYCFRNRNGKYFICSMITDIKADKEYIEKHKFSYYEELDYLKYMGLRDNILYVDGAYFKDIKDFKIDDCFLIIDDNDNLMVREKWNGENWAEDEDFDKKAKKIDLKNKFITIIDFHN